MKLRAFACVLVVASINGAALADRATDLTKGQSLYNAADYRGALAATEDAVAPPARGAAPFSSADLRTLFDLRVLRAECDLKLKDGKSAQREYGTAWALGSESAQRPKALFLAELLDNAPDVTYRTADGQAFDLSDEAGRNNALKARFDQEIDKLTRVIDHAAAQGMLPEIGQVYTTVRLVGMQEYMATGSTTRTDSVADRLAVRTHALIDDDLTRIEQTTRSLTDRASSVTAVSFSAGQAGVLSPSERVALLNDVKYLQNVGRLTAVPVKVYQFVHLAEPSRAWAELTKRAERDQADIETLLERTK